MASREFDCISAARLQRERPADVTSSSVPVEPVGWLRHDYAGTAAADSGNSSHAWYLAIEVTAIETTCPATFRPYSKLL